MTVELSVVSCLYDSAAFVREFCRRTAATAAGITDRFEIVLVNDGSPDGSLAAALELIEDVPQLVVVDLARHYGHYPAMLAGLARSRGSCVWLIDCDLEEQPEWLPEFWRQLGADPEVDVVVGVQRRRRGGWFERWSGAAFYTLLRITAGEPIAANNTVARIMRRPYVDALVGLRERPVSFDVLAAAAGFRQRTLEVDKPRLRPGGYSLGRKLSLAVESLLAYGRLFPWLTMLAGSTLAGGALLALAISAKTQEGWTPSRVLPLSGFLVGGILIAAVGAVSLQLALLLDQIRGRPTVVRRVYGAGTTASRKSTAEAT